MSRWYKPSFSPRFLALLRKENELQAPHSILLGPPFAQQGNTRGGCLRSQGRGSGESLVDTCIIVFHD